MVGGLYRGRAASVSISTCPGASKLIRGTAPATPSRRLLLHWITVSEKATSLSRFNPALPPEVIITASTS